MSSESNISHIIFNQMSENKYSSLIPTEGEFYVTPDYINLPLLTSMWFDHIVNDISWLRSDTFAWQSGDVYTAVYNHLVNDISGKTAVSENVGGVTISYYLADDGHKITTDETSVSNIYTVTGVAWYYILDTTNHRFKLPRTKFGFTGLRNNVGNYVAPGLPNITGDLAGNRLGISSTVGGAGYGIGAFTGGIRNGDGILSSSDYGAGIDTGLSNRTALIKFNAQYSNSIYGNSSTVQPPATQMYLYFYVGNFTNSAIEQTAGITTAALNNKMDNDLGNSGPISDTFKARLNTSGIRYVKETYKSGTNWYRIWSDGWIEQGGQFAGSTTINASTTTVTFIKPFSSYVAIAGGFTKSSNSATYGQNLWQNGNTTLTTMVCSLPAYTSNGQVAHANSAGTGYWYACGY